MLYDSCVYVFLPETKDDGGPLLNPVQDDPNSHLKFEFDSKTYLAYVTGTSRRGITTEQLIGLNRIDLLAYRSYKVKMLEVIARLSHTDMEARNLLEEATHPEREYAAFARELWEKVAGLLPPEEGYS